MAAPVALQLTREESVHTATRARLILVIYNIFTDFPCGLPVVIVILGGGVAVVGVAVFFLFRRTGPQLRAQVQNLGKKHHATLRTLGRYAVFPLGGRGAGSSSLRD